MNGFLYAFRVAGPYVVLPPPGFLWLAVLGMVLARRRPRTGRWLAIVGLAGLYATGTPLVSHALLDPLEHLPPAGGGAIEPQAIIVLSADSQRVTDAPDGAAPGALTIERMAGAAILARRTGLPVLMTGGTLGPYQPPIADIMARDFQTMNGLHAEWSENRSRNTCENAKFSARILRNAGISAAWVVTSAAHIPRSLIAFERAGFPVVPFPVHASIYEPDSIFAFLPRPTGWERSIFAVHEWIGLLAYRLGICPSSAD